MPWKVDYCDRDGNLYPEVPTVTEDMEIAELAYRKLLAQADLAGKPFVARLLTLKNYKGRWKSIYFSRFDDETRRIHPDAPLNLLREDDGTTEAAAWRPGPEKDTDSILDDLRATAAMLKTWGAEICPKPNELGQVSFSRAMLDAAAETIEASLVAVDAATTPKQKKAEAL